MPAPSGPLPLSVWNCLRLLNVGPWISPSPWGSEPPGNVKTAFSEGALAQCLVNVECVPCKVIFIWGLHKVPNRQAQDWKQDTR